MMSRVALTLCLAGMMAACGTTTTTNAQPTDPTPKPVVQPPASVKVPVDTAAVTALAQKYGAAKSARQFGAIWDLMAEPSRRLAISVSKGPAEADDTRAKLQGFDSAAHVKSLDDRSYFVARRQTLAGEGKYAYKTGVTVTGVSLGKPVHVPFPGQRLLVYPATLKLSDGGTDLVGVTQHDGGYRIIEP